MPHSPPALPTTTDDASGLGDLEIRTGVVGRLTPTLRYGLAVNAVLETATDSLLSDNAFVLRPIAALRWDFNAVSTLGINVEYNFTPLDEEANDVSALELKFPVTFKINDAWSAFLSYNPRWNLLAESSRQFVETRRVGLAIRGECSKFQRGFLGISGRQYNRNCGQRRIRRGEKGHRVYIQAKVHEISVAFAVRTVGKLVLIRRHDIDLAKDHPEVS
ncbi:MAG: hypothetical protein NTV46_10120 [Verrucomicrobia bacterium]|nr:hypothetical protein [Verrucomicrobiota bacterium]